MATKALTLLLILTVLTTAVGLWFAAPPAPKPHKIEVGKSLAMVRMRRLGIVNGDWREYTTARLHLV
jgi:hypothetical protein